jgi:WD40 repeat protein
MRLDLPARLLGRLPALGAVVFSPDHRWVAWPARYDPDRRPSAWDQFLARWNGGSVRFFLADRRSGVVARSWLEPETAPGLHFSPDGARLAYRVNNRVCVRDVATGRELGRYRPPLRFKQPWLDDLAWEPDGRLRALCAPSWFGPARVWDVEAGRAIRSIPELTREPSGRNGWSHSPDGRWLLDDPNPILPDQPVRQQLPADLFDLRNGQRVGSLTLDDPDGSREVSALTVSPDGRRVVTIALNLSARPGEPPHPTMRDLRSTADGTILARLPGGSEEDGGAAFSPDGKWAAVDVGEGTAVLLDADTGAILFRWRPHGDKRLDLLSFTPDGQVATSARGTDDLQFLDLTAVRKRLSALGLDW